MMDNIRAVDSHAGAGHLGLTSREKEITGLLAQGETVRQVAAKLGLSFKTVETHKGNLMRKLALRNRLSLKSYAVDAGLVQAA